MMLVNASVSWLPPAVRLVDRGRRRTLTPSRQRRAVYSPVSRLRTGGRFPCPYRILRPSSSLTAPTAPRPSSTTNPETYPMVNPNSDAFRNLGNDPIEDKPPPRPLSKRELRKRGKKVGGDPEKLEVRRDSHLSQQNVVLDPHRGVRGKRDPIAKRKKRKPENPRSSRHVVLRISSGTMAF